MTTVDAAKGAAVTEREAEVLALLARHLTNAQIADELFISVRTVESHVSALLRKLQFADRRSLARHADAAARFSIDSPRRALPAAVTPFVGRTRERAALMAALAEHRMVTATGPGGVGKTRLALSVAAEVGPARGDGVWFVDLVNVSDPAMVTSVVAETVGVPEQRSSSIDRALVATLAGRDALLVLDNCEHVVDGVRRCVERIVAGCPHVTVLATSRARLMLPYERVYAVPGLSVTDVGGDAVDLFAARVDAITGGREPIETPRVTALCRALDGIALAIELAAARFPTLGLDGLEAGLDERLRLLTAGTRTADRHRSLRDAIGWSYDLLTPDDQELLRSVAVLVSWFDVGAACAVSIRQRDRGAVADGLGRLADHSLLVVDRGGPTRYRALEAIRQFGVERLDSAGELPTTRARHGQWCRDAITGLAAGEPDEAWCARFDRVVDDIRAALAWSAGDRQTDAAELAGGLAGLLFVRGRPREAQLRYEQAAQLAGSAAERAEFLRLAAGAAASRYVGNDAVRLLRAAADTAIESGDRAIAARDLAWASIYMDRAPGIMADRPTADEAAALRNQARAISVGSARAEAAIAVSWTMLSNTAAQPSDARNPGASLEATRHAVDLAHRAGDAVLESAALDELTAVHVALDDIPEAARVARRRLEVIGTLAVSARNGFELLDCHLMASDVYLAAGDLAAAGEHADALAHLSFLRGEDHLGVTRRLKVDALAGRFDNVVRGAERFRLGWERAGRPTASDLSASVHAVAMVHGMLGDEARRAEWLRMTIEVLGSSPYRLDGCTTGWAPTFDALLALHRDDSAAALERLSADVDDRQQWGFWNAALWRPWYAALWAEAAVLEGRSDALPRLERSRDAVRDNRIASAIVERAAAIAAGKRDAVERCASTFARLGCPYQQRRTEVLAARIA